MTDPFAQVAALPGVADAVAAAREAVDRLLAHRVLRQRSAEVSAEAALRGARASAALEGSPVPLEAVRAGAVDDPFVRGALRVSAELGTMPETWRHTPRQVLARLHALTTADLTTATPGTASGGPAASGGTSGHQAAGAQTAPGGSAASGGGNAEAEGIPGRRSDSGTRRGGGARTVGHVSTPGGHAGGDAAERGAASGHGAAGAQAAPGGSAASGTRRDGARTVGNVSTPGGGVAESGAGSGHWAADSQAARGESASSGRDGDARTVGGATPSEARVVGGSGTTATVGISGDVGRTGIVGVDGFDEGRLGRPRTAGQDVHSALDIGPAPDAAEMAARLDALMGLLTARTEAPALVVGAIVHAELLALRPFGLGDGIVARAAQRVTFIERGLDPKALAAPEVGHAELADEYVDALRAYMTGTPTGVATWVRHCADAVSAAARDSLAVCEAMKRGQVTRSA